MRRHLELLQFIIHTPGWSTTPRCSNMAGLWRPSGSGYTFPATAATRTGPATLAAIGRPKHNSGELRLHPRPAPRREHLSVDAPTSRAALAPGGASPSSRPGGTASNTTPYLPAPSPATHRRPGLRLRPLPRRPHSRDATPTNSRVRPLSEIPGAVNIVQVPVKK